jgi:hypothetical protein
MHLSFKPTATADFQRCLSLLREGFVYEDLAKARLPHLWREILERRCGESAVIEDEERPFGERVLGFGLSAFVTDEFVHEAKTRLSPYISCHILERWTQGCSPILSFEDVCRANSGDGLNVLAMHHGWLEHGLGAKEIASVRHMLLESFIAGHRGYRLKEFLEEVYGDSELRWLRVIGVRLLTDYASFLGRDSTPPPARDRHPYLVGITRAEALQQDSTMTYAAFFSAAPRFLFTPAEQELLRHALLGETDEGLASTMKIAVVTVKKRWEVIYERVISVDPHLLLEKPAAIPGKERRGAEKRRHLLAYLRHHPEELRPISSPKIPSRPISSL